MQNKIFYILNLNMEVMAITDVKREVRESILEQLKWDERVLSDNVEVDVDEGVVTLTGKVPNYFSRLAAEEDALSIIGVTHVENHLTVAHADEQNIPGDTEIKKAIDNMLELDNRLDDEELIVEVNSGEVTLRGIVNSFWKKALAEEYANRAKGIVHVTNRIKIVPAVEFEDEKIYQEIRKALQRNTLTHESAIDIHVAEGEVTLTGTVRSPHERKKAVDLASHTSGVLSVNDNLRIESLP